MSIKQRVPDGLVLQPMSEAPALSQTAADQILRVVDPPGVRFGPEEATGIGLVAKAESAEAASPFLRKAFELYRGRCECGAHYENNCAHFLTDAMVRAGLPKPFSTSDEKCSAGRLIRAKECLEWFRTFSTGFSTGHQLLKTGYWLVYQENSGGQGHVCLHLEMEGNFVWRGTTDLSGWGVNWHYFY